MRRRAKRKDNKNKTYKTSRKKQWQEEEEIRKAGKKEKFGEERLRKKTNQEGLRSVEWPRCIQEHDMDSF